MSSIPDEALKVAAKWWADCLRKTMKQDNGDPSTGGGMAMVMKTLLAGKSRPDGASADRFEAALALRLGEVAPCGYIYVGVDYHPDGYLQDAMGSADLPEGSEHRFPIKTAMSIASDKVTVRCGYGAESETLWTAPIPSGVVPGAAFVPSVG